MLRIWALFNRRKRVNSWALRQSPKLGTDAALM